MTNSYDRVPYPNRPYAQSHPDNLAVLGRLHGMEPPPVERARVLDLGASEGGNIIPMAVTLPDAQFTGLDLAAVPVERGNEVIRALGLTNVRLLQMDLLEVAANFGEFDYIIAHGLYAWTPAPVRDKILAIARAHLSPQGIAFVSYNTYPGGHLRKLLREAMVFNARGVENPAQRLERARAMLGLLAAGRPEPEHFDVAIAVEAAEVADRTDSSIYHDYMSDVYEPCYLRDFVDHAGRHGLQYLDDASALDTSNARLSPEAVAEAHKSAGTDRIAREQYLDMLRMRQFRQSLVCRADLPSPLEPEWSAARAVGLFAACPALETGEGEFTNSRGVKVTTRHPGVIGLFRKLIEVWPRSERIDAEQADIAVEMFRRGLIDLRSVPGAAAPAGERPVASPLARFQAQRGDAVVTTLNHRALEVDEEEARRFLVLLDGTRDRDALARESGHTRTEVDKQLEALGRHGMLLA